MDRSKIIAILTGVVSLILAIGYLVLVQILDFRGEMVPAPTDLSYNSADVEYSVAIVDWLPHPFSFPTL
ncbi:hypothetical protein [Oculatella sp. LEGE 06141]|uniref:hypothetical protein n=1 Tax=Oculatella sp. LEGE 06141 TaxID=1828648 RepID=UPI001D157391|nr:hypothetical protein [Oculatella sp. LEGE 06141]